MEEIRNVVQMLLNGLQKMEYVNLTLMLDGTRFSTRQDYRHFSLELGRTSTVLWLDLMMAGIQYNVRVRFILWLTKMCLAFAGGHVHSEPQHEPDKIWWQTSVQSAGESVLLSPPSSSPIFCFSFPFLGPTLGSATDWSLLSNILPAYFRHVVDPITAISCVSQPSRSFTESTET